MKNIDEIIYAIAFDSLEGEIEKEKLKLRDAETEEEQAAVEKRLARLVALRNEELKHKVKPIDIFNVAVNGLAGIAVLGVEHTGIIASKLWAPVQKAIFK
jgi:hypothetical protein